MQYNFKDRITRDNVTDIISLDVSDSTRGYLHIHSRGYLQEHSRGYLQVHNKEYLQMHRRGYLQIHSRGYLQIHLMIYLQIHGRIFIDTGSAESRYRYQRLFSYFSLFSVR